MVILRRYRAWAGEQLLSYSAVCADVYIVYSCTESEREERRGKKEGRGMVR
jgi:hypothetical protein